MHGLYWQTFWYCNEMKPLRYTNPIGLGCIVFGCELCKCGVSFVIGPYFSALSEELPGCQFTQAGLVGGCTPHPIQNFWTNCLCSLRVFFWLCLFFFFFFLVDAFLFQLLLCWSSQTLKEALLTAELGAWILCHVQTRYGAWMMAKIKTRKFSGTRNWNASAIAKITRWRSMILTRASILPKNTPKTHFVSTQRAKKEADPLTNVFLGEAQAFLENWLNFVQRPPLPPSHLMEVTNSTDFCRLPFRDLCSGNEKNKASVWKKERNHDCLQDSLEESNLLRWCVSSSSVIEAIVCLLFNSDNFGALLFLVQQ